MISTYLLKKINNLHWSLIFIITLMSCLGFAILYSAAQGNFQPWALKQIIRFSAFFPIMLMIALINIKFWYKYSYVIYVLSLIALILTEIIGVKAMGATRWLRIGPFNIQPSELMKICIIFALARYFHGLSVPNTKRMAYLIPPMLIIAAPVILVLNQPDLGTSFIILMVGVVVLFAAGIQIWKFVFVGVAGLVSIPFLWNYVLHDYQKQRVLGFLDPENDPLGNGYNILQSKIAIGSGGFSGKGFLKGTQSQLSFLPEKQTDFIFTMFTEEFGFLGGILIIFLYILIMAYGCFIALTSHSHYGRLMAIGVVSIVFFHVFINMAMVMGLIPIVGAPLPLLSYGGTIMLTILIAFGMLLNVHLHSEDSLKLDTKVSK